MKVLIKTFCIILPLLFQAELSAQNVGWFKVNATPYMFSLSPFDTHSDCFGMPHLGGIPNNFYEHIITDSLFISKDMKQVRLVLRYITQLEQIDTNDMSNYTLGDTLKYPIYYRKMLKYKKVGDSFYWFNYVLEGSSENKLDSIVLQKAIKVQNKNNCKNNFPFGCQNRFNIDVGGVWYFNGKGKSKQKPYPDCYKVTELKKLKNDAKQFSVSVPLQHYYIGSGRSYLELHDYLTSWDSSLNIFLNPYTGRYNSKTKLWILEYDTVNKSTKGTIGIYNGGCDTLNIQECNTTAGNAIINGFPEFIAPASWGYIQLEFLNGSIPLSPHESLIFMRVSKNKSLENLIYYPIKYRVQ